MSLLNSNVNGEKGLFSVIKNDRPNNELVWKYTKEDFNNNTQLIVMESEEALFVKDGVILESFSGGKYTLNTDNYPFITKLRSKITGGENAFNCKVYFIDKTHKLELYWGTDSPIQLRDAEYGFAVSVRARGSYSVEIKDSKKFLIKLVGLNTQEFTDEDIKDKFRTVFQTKIKTIIARTMKESHYTILDMNTELENLGDIAIEGLTPVLDEYGIRLVNFYIADISIPDDDPNYHLINEAYAKAHAGKIEVQVQGEDWNRLTAKELAKDLVNNESAGGMANMGAGLGMGIASGEAFGNIAKQLFNSNSEEVHTKIIEEPKNNTLKCSNCGNDIPANSKFCPNCGTKVGENKCSNCGNILLPNTKFCPNCGTKVSDN